MTTHTESRPVKYLIANLLAALVFVAVLVGGLWLALT